MHSLLFLCARRLLSHRPGARRAVAVVPTELYPVLFRAAFLDGRVLALRELVAAWPFPVLSLRRLLGHQRLDGKTSKLCVQTVLLAVAEQLRRALEEPRHGRRWVLGGQPGAIFFLLCEGLGLCAPLPGEVGTITPLLGCRVAAAPLAAAGFTHPLLFAPVSVGATCGCST